MTMTTRTEPAGAPQLNPQDIAALVRSEMDGHVAGLKSQIDAMQAEAQARAQHAVPDTSSRDAAEKRINETVAALAELKNDNAALRASLDAMAARTAAPAGATDRRSANADLVDAMVKAGVVEHASRGSWSRDKQIEINRPLDISARAVTTLDTSLMIPQSTVQPYLALDQGHNRPRSFVDFVPELPPIGVAVYPFIRETAVGGGALGFHTKLTAQTESGSAVLTVDNTAGAFPGMVIRIHDGGGMIERTILTVDSGTQITCTATMGATVETAQSVTSVDVGTTAEGYTKPAALWGYESDSVTLRVLAHYIPLSVQALATVPGLEAELSSRLLSGLRYTLSQQLVSGLGTAPSTIYAGSIHGVVSSTTSPTYAWSDGEVGDTMFDAIAMATASLRFPAAATIHVNPIDLRNMSKAKVAAAGGGAYVFPLMGGSIDGYRAIDGSIVTAFGTIHPCWEVTQGDFFVVQHDLFSKVVRNTNMDRVVVGYTGNQFILNQQTILAETMVEHMIVRPNACVIGEFDEAPSAG
jgi:hypothetical protein